MEVALVALYQPYCLVNIGNFLPLVESGKNAIRIFQLARTQSPALSPRSRVRT